LRNGLKTAVFYLVSGDDSVAVFNIFGSSDFSLTTVTTTIYASHPRQYDPLYHKEPDRKTTQYQQINIINKINHSETPLS